MVGKRTDGPEGKRPSLLKISRWGEQYTTSPWIIRGYLVLGDRPRVLVLDAESGRSRAGVIPVPYDLEALEIL
jgi:hypothetical protein